MQVMKRVYMLKKYVIVFKSEEYSLINSAN